MNDETLLISPARLRPIATALFASMLARTSFHPTSVAGAETYTAFGLKLIGEAIGAPSALAAIPDGSGRLLVSEQAGIIHLVDHDRKKPAQPFLDLRKKIPQLGHGMEERG